MLKYMSVELAKINFDLGKYDESTTLLNEAMKISQLVYANNNHSGEVYHPKIGMIIRLSLNVQAISIFTHVIR